MEKFNEFNQIKENHSQKRVMLTEEDFKLLVAGKFVERDGVTIALSDIGFDRMYLAIDEAMKKM